MKVFKYLFLLLIVYLFFPIIISASNFTCTYNNVVTNLNNFYNNLENKNFIVSTNKFLCSSLTCNSSGTYSNIGLINISEYDAIGGKNSYLSSINNYWTMTEDGTSSYNIKSTGSELISKTNISGLKPVIYVTGEVNGGGNKINPYKFTIE